MPSGFFKAMTNTAAPGFNRFISPGALARTVVRADAVFGFAAREGDVQHRALRGLSDGADRSVGHNAVRHQIPGELPAAIRRRFGEDASLDCVNLAVLTLDPGRGDTRPHSRRPRRLQPCPSNSDPLLLSLQSRLDHLDKAKQAFGGHRQLENLGTERSEGIGKRLFDSTWDREFESTLLQR